MITPVLEVPIERSQSRPLSKALLPLCVELDDTLINTDSFLESLLLLLKRNPIFLFLIPVWAIRGFKYFQEQIAKRIQLDVSNIPYCQHVVAYLQEEAKQGRELILLAGWNLKIAQAVGNHLNCFSRIIARSDFQQRSQSQAQNSLEPQCDIPGFEYMANGKIDRQIANASQKLILVESLAHVGQDHKYSKSEQVLNHKKKHTFPTILKALRVHQWVKNILLFLPIATAHQFFNIDLLLQASLAFVAFSLCASGLYIFNDLLDLPADRRHPKKKFRPFASGALSIKAGLWLHPLLLCAAFSISLLTLPKLFSIILVSYALTTIFYSTYLKKVAILDVLVLAGFYTLRIIAGGAAVGVPISAWLLAFSVFFFLSLAFGKRYAELQLRKVDKFQGIERRAYLGADKEIVGTMGTISGYMSVLVLALYINSKEVFSIYQTPNYLWFICPLLLYWISRTWLLAHRGSLDDDPLIVALKDPNSYVVGAGVAILAALAI